MSLASRIARLEKRWGAQGCPGCGWAEVLGPVTFSIRTEDDDGPTHCQVCGRPLGFTMALGDPETVARVAARRNNSQVTRYGKSKSSQCAERPTIKPTPQRNDLVLVFLHWVDTSSTRKKRGVN